MKKNALEDVAAAWDQVIQRRVRELQTGAVETIPWKAVRAKLFEGFEDPSENPGDPAD